MLTATSRPIIDVRHNKTQNLPMKSYEDLYTKVNNDAVSLKNVNQSVDALEESALKKNYS